MKTPDPTSRQFFEEKYRATLDPWSFATSTYEQRRYAVILEHMGDRRYARVFEPGCSIGVLTELLADRCDHVFAIDIAETAVAAARLRCVGLDNVTIERGSLPDDLPTARFDLIVFSEIGYYLDEQELVGLARRLGRQLSDGGVLIAAHWTGRSEDHVLTGERTHELLDEHLGIEHAEHVSHRADTGTTAERTGGFVLDTWTAATRDGS